MGIKLTGINELQVKLKRNADLSAVKTIVKKNGADMHKKAQRNAPVDTGTLKRSITLKTTDGGLTAESESGAEYSGYVEWGTRYQEPQFFMGDALIKQGEEFKKDMRKLVR